MHKEKIRRLVDQLPEEVDVGAFLEKLHLLQKIELGEKQIADGNGIPHESAKKRLQHAARLLDTEDLG